MAEQENTTKGVLSCRVEKDNEEYVLAFAKLHKWSTSFALNEIIRRHREWSEAAKKNLIGKPKK